MKKVRIYRTKDRFLVELLNGSNVIAVCYMNHEKIMKIVKSGINWEII